MTDATQNITVRDEALIARSIGIVERALNAAKNANHAGEDAIVRMATTLQKPPPNTEPFLIDLTDLGRKHDLWIKGGEVFIGEPDDHQLSYRLDDDSNLFFGMEGQ